MVRIPSYSQLKALSDAEIKLELDTMKQNLNSLCEEWDRLGDEQKRVREKILLQQRAIAIWEEFSQ